MNGQKITLRIDNGDLEDCAPGGAFSLIHWLFMNQSGHKTCQRHIYSVISFINMVIANLKI